MLCSELSAYISAGGLDKRLAELYGEDAARRQRERYRAASEKFITLYGDRETCVFSASGRSEISGNHTDHNKGCVLAASIDLDVIAFVSKTDDGVIRIKSEGFDGDTVKLGCSPDRETMRYTSEAIIYGVCDGFEKRGYNVGGFCAYTTSSVLKGSGLSSSAAFEDIVGFILSELYNGGGVDSVTVAEISQYAENAFFGKPCGLMDQTACAVGGFVFIDFKDEEPFIEPIKFDLGKAGYDLCIVDTGGSHADLNEDYASVPSEMKAVAALFGQNVLRGITEEQIISKLPRIRKELGDRYALRALHFIRENERVTELKNALERGDTEAFLEGIKASGDSSFKFLQNVYTNKAPQEQGLSLALCVSEGLLKDGKGVCRVHGGGFAGTVQAFVKREYTREYKEEIEKVFGKGSCTVLKVRAEGTAVVIR